MAPRTATPGANNLRLVSGTGAILDPARNDAYWDKVDVHIPAVEYQFTPEEASQYARYRAGHCSELSVAPWLATAYHGIALTHESLGKSVALRQALAMAIDRKELTATLEFGQFSAYGMVPQGTLNYVPEQWPWTRLGNDERVAAAWRLYAACEPGVMLMTVCVT